MKNLIILLGLVIVSSCSDHSIDNKKMIDTLKSCDLELFKYVRMAARHERDGVFMVPSFSKEIENKSFNLPSFFYYDCQEKGMECLEKAVALEKFNLIEYASINGITDEKEAFDFVKDYSNQIITEYRKTGMVEILSDLKIGEDCIIFYPDKQHYIAYVPKLSKVYNEYWQERFVKENKVEDGWYAGELKK